VTDRPALTAIRAMRWSRVQEKHMRELRDTFQKFDAQNKGHLDVRELGA